MDNEAYQDSKWETVGTRLVQYILMEGVSSAEWGSFDFTTDPFREPGILQVAILNTTLFNDNNERWYRNIQFEWQFFINSSTLINGERDSITQNKIFRKNTEESITVGDAPSVGFPVSAPNNCSQSY